MNAASLTRPEGASRFPCLAACVACGLLTASPAVNAFEPQPGPKAALAVAGLQAPAGLQPGPPAGQYQGNANCQLCHNQPTAADDGQSPLPREFCRLDEMQRFKQHDKHDKAFSNLKWSRNDQGQPNLSAAICERLGIADLDQAQECLGCHANWIKGLERPRNYQEGVSCEACHGPSSVWEKLHWDQNKKDWRARPAHEKAALGMVDVRDPAARARQCFSCHIGDARQGKWVTHAMYAAGHPPLPSIELGTFLEAMPRHWRSIREKGNFEKRDQYLAATFPAAAAELDRDLPRTRTVLVGALVALRQSLDLFAELAQPSQGLPPDAYGGWPEFSAFDCQACHHDLKSKGFRQSRRPPGRPGRPRCAEWPTALLPAALAALGGGNAGFAGRHAQFENRMKRLNQALDRVPFGDPGMIAAAIRGPNGLLEWLDAQADALAAAVIDELAARAALQRLLDPQANGQIDFHSARQIVWALRLIETELAAGYPDRAQFAVRTGTEEPAARGRLDASDLAVFDQWLQTRWHAALEKAAVRTNDFSGMLFLDLPAGASGRIDLSQPQFLKRVAEYDAGLFSRQLRRLGTAEER